ncbi:MAG: hypothetical protein ABSF65_05825 [Candidatus Bathyarchaeia archaeon]|jgi:hypothetical protein
MAKKIPRGRAGDSIEDLQADDMLTSGKPWVKSRQQKKKNKKAELPEDKT